MVKKLENELSIAPFLLKCYEMVNDESTDELISWSESCNNSFIIWDVSKFTSELLPKYFKHSNFASFIRQLNIYGFRKTDTDRWEFTNEAFVRGQKNLLKNIIRRKQPQAQAQRKSSEQPEVYANVSKEDKRVDLRKEVENLITDKNILMQELIMLSQHQQSSQSKLILLREQLKGMEKNQQQMLSFIVMALQNPGIFIKFLHPKESNWLPAETGKKIVTQVDDDCDPVSSEGAIVPYQLPMAEASELECAPVWEPADIPETSNAGISVETGKKIVTQVADDSGSDPLSSEGAIVPYQLPMAEASEMECAPVWEPADIPESSDAGIPMDLEISDEIGDLLRNMDFSMGPLDEKWFPLESHGPFVLPDIPDDDHMLEQFLLSSPRPDSVEFDDLDTEASDNHGTKMQSAVWEKKI